MSKSIFNVNIKHNNETRQPSVFKVIAKGNKAHLDVFEFISALSIMLRGTIEEKTRCLPL